MNEAKLYYTPPGEEMFDEVRIAAMQLWKDIDTDNDKYGYSSGKIDRIKNIENVSDNFMYMVAMFDHGNQTILASRLSIEARLAIRERMIDGGSSPEYIPF